MYRRRFLSGSGVVVGASLAGCSSDEGGDIQDSDGDGVIDSEDYAPNDPEVQEKSDLKSTENITPTPTESPTPTPTESPTPTPTESPTPTPTETPTPTPTPDPNTLSVDDSYWTDTSHIASYSSELITTRINEDFPETDYDSTKLLVSLIQFPREELVDQSLSDQFNRSNGSQEITLSIDSGGTQEDELYHYRASLVPGDATLDNLSYSESSVIMETDPIHFTSGVMIERTPYGAELDDDSGETYARNNVEGAYDLEISGRTNGEDWSVGFFAWKSAHAEAYNRDRGRSRSEYVSYELDDGTATELAQLLSDEADARGFNDRESAEFVIDFVQALPYVPDDVSRGFDDYTKFIIETIPEMGGDCEDTAIMLASVLEAEPFNYDMILIQPPGHMAAGVWNSDPTGYYYELDDRSYEYIETTGRGWGIGDCPEQYQGEDAYLYQV